jgi:proteasome accessory factor B
MNLSRDEMTARKSERLLNLLITLLVARTYVSKERIRSVIEAYAEAGDDAFEKMFERDKEELRSLGIPIEVGHVDRAFGDEPGYRVERSAFELPDIDLDPQEAAVIGLAARVWQHAGLAHATSDALVKLKAAGISVDRAALDIVQPQLTAEEPAFEPLWDATRTRTPVRFGYRSTTSADIATRHLQPWGVVSFRGRWYVVGHDTDRGRPRVFRLSRVHGDVLADGPAGAFEVPPGTDLRAVTQALAPAPADRSADVLVRVGAAHGLRRHAHPAPPQGDGGPAVPEGWERLAVGYGSGEALADEVLGYGADVVVLAPQDVRASVVRRLREAGRHRLETVPAGPADGVRR